jgi:hypothetical protein
VVYPLQPNYVRDFCLKKNMISSMVSSLASTSIVKFKVTGCSYLAGFYEQAAASCRVCTDLQAI